MNDELRLRQRFGLGPVTAQEKGRAEIAATPVGREATRLYELAQRYRIDVTWEQCLAQAQAGGNDEHTR